MAVNIGVIGAGKFGTVHLNAFRQLEYNGVARLAAVAESSPDRATEIEQQYGCPVFTNYRQMLERIDLDAVSIATPDHLHREIAIAAAKAGKHILCEKPLDITVEGCEAMVQAANDAHVMLMVDFHKRYDPDHQAIEARVAAGELGDILYGYVHMEDRIEVPRDWFPHWAPASSPAWFLGVHFYDLVRWIIKSNASSVYATGSKRLLAQVWGVDTYDCVNAKIEFENGATFAFDTSWILPNDFESIVNQGLRIIGTKGIWECDSQDRGSRSCVDGEGMRTYNSSFMCERLDKQGRKVFRGYGVESIEDFAYNVALLKSGADLDTLEGKYASGIDGLEATKMAVAVHKSVETGKVVKL